MTGTLPFKTVWITGAGQGLGRSAALALAKAGGKVAISARTKADLEAVRQTALDQGLAGTIHPFPLDVTDQEASIQTIKDIESLLGPLDLAILNAGTHQAETVDNLTTETFEKLMAVNYFGVIHAIVPLVNIMRQRGHGQIGIVASLSGYQGLPTAAAYGASKAALINMAESLRAEIGYGYPRLSVINPGFVKTPLTDKNDFPMPFLLEADDAADQMIKGLARDRFEITFPKPFSYLFKLIRMLPYGLSIPLIGRTTKK